MTVKELIVTLLDMPMDSEVMIEDAKPQMDEHGESTTSVFGVSGVYAFSGSTTCITFKDWRHKANSKVK